MDRNYRIYRMNVGFADFLAPNGGEAGMRKSC
jgi:hypothetical protein